jgi:hypothetical protein
MENTTDASERERALQLRSIQLRSITAKTLLQTEIIWRHWELEATRLFSLFWGSGDERHLRAFSAHVRAMRGYAGRRRS